MRLPSRLVIVLVVCLIAVALPAVPAQAQQCGLPVIELSPPSGVPGTEVTVNGQRFDTDKYVDISYDGTIIATGRTNMAGDFTILFVVPEGCKGTYIVHAKVGADFGYDTADTHFTVKPGLTVNPENGPVGTNVTVTGQGFAKNEEGIELMYYLGDRYETVERRIAADAQGSWEMSFQIPPSAKGAHKIDAEGDDSQVYEVEDATFEVTAEISIDKPSGKVGEVITMTGSRFVAYERNIRILLDGQSVVTDIRADAQGDWEESFEVPEMPAGMYSVTAEGESTKKEDVVALSFETKPDIALSLSEGHVGMNLTVTGHGFAADEDIAIMYEDEDNEVATARTNTQGSFGVTFLVPESQYNTHQVMARDPAGNNATSTIVMESDPPDTPELISPSNGGRVGLIGRVRPTFGWSEVSDESGVRYRLQIATSASVTATAGFVDPIFSVGGLAETSYTLEESEALPYGTYYWIVQAVDGVENKSDWTVARSFRAGLLPMWAFILIIVAIVVLLIALIRALVRRSRYYYE